MDGEREGKRAGDEERSRTFGNHKKKIKSEGLEMEIKDEQGGECYMLQVNPKTPVSSVFIYSDIFKVCSLSLKPIYSAKSTRL